jgi:hypothetical protein
MIKIKHGNNEVISFNPKKPDHPAHAYGHAPVRILVWNNHFSHSCRINFMAGLYACPID